MRITAVTCVNNEGPFLLEWIAFNRLIGVTDFLFYSNDCTDGTDRLLDALQAKGIVQHLPNPTEGRNFQNEALQDAHKQEVVKKADWVWIADVDEFLNIHVGDGTIPALIKACGDPHAISVTFQFFANAGVIAYKDVPVIGQFSRSHNPDIWCNETAIEVKTLTHADFPVKTFGAHRPFLRDNLAKNERPVWTDGSGREVPFKFKIAANKRRIRKFPARGAREFATLNRYSLRSLDSYLVKNDRGAKNRETQPLDDTFWRERNDDIWEDRSIGKYMAALKKEISTLKKDKDIKSLHAEAVSTHKATLSRLLKDKAYKTFRNQLKSAPRISPQEERLMEMIG